MRHSHLPQDNRALVDEIMKQLKQAHVSAWEYLDCNKAGENWDDRLQEAMHGTSVFVVLLTDDYEHSPHCQRELRWAVQHNLPVLAFLVEGRTAVHVELPSALHQQPLRESLEANAAAVVGRVIEVIK